MTGLWIFMLIMNLLVPVIMIGFGSYASKHAPKEINYIFGYRTQMSMKNKDTWEFAHHYCGKLWLVIGWILLPVTVIAMCTVLGKNEDTIGIFSIVICLVQVVVLIASIAPTEYALKKTFDENGLRR